MAEARFAALRPRRSNIITPEEFSGVMILLRRGRRAAKCSSAIHYIDILLLYFMPYIIVIFLLIDLLGYFKSGFGL